MARFRVSRPAQADLTHILATSAQRRGTEGRRRYAALLVAAMRKAAADPQGVVTRDRSEAGHGIRSLHIRHVSVDPPKDRVRAPVHILYCRVVGSDLIEIVRVLHERMEPSQHIGAGRE